MIAAYKRADDAMYSAKDAGRNLSFWHDGSGCRPTGESQVEDARAGMLAHVLCSCDATLPKTSFVRELAVDWMDSADPHRRRCGYMLLYELGKKKTKAYDDAAHHGDVYEAWSGRDIGYRRIPETAALSLREDTRYVHVTSNETIGGIQFRAWPEVAIPLVADMSSDLFSRRIPWERFDVVYGGVQKNLAPAGLAVVSPRCQPNRSRAGARLRSITGSSAIVPPTLTPISASPPNISANS